MKDFWELEVWKRAYSLHHWVYALIDSYPSVALDEMAPRMRQASLAIAAEIAEGCGAYQNNGGRRHFNAALGAVSALDCLMFLAYDMRLIPSGCAKHFLGRRIDIEERLRALLNEEATGRCAPASLRLVQ
ncbi:MAG TPA: four helix bundle protein [Terracidiphilus sp.]|nr:four helix bundle protein [Terracidiphilus sp.]